MKLRYALITQAPSLELQRAAHAEICRLDQHASAMAAALQAMLAAHDAEARGSSPLWPGTVKAAREALASYRTGEAP